MQISVSDILLCTREGRIVAGNHLSGQLSAGQLPGDTSARVAMTTLAEWSQHLHCPQLAFAFTEFVNSAAVAQEVSLPVNEQPGQIRLRRLSAEPGEPLFLLELAATKEAEAAHDTSASSSASSSSASSSVSYPEIGSLAARLLHDFKNQISGLKLYTSWLKKHCATAPGNDGPTEFAEILQKMSDGLNVMAEHAHLISRLTQPLKLKLAPASLESLIHQLVDETMAQAAARHVRISAAPPPEMLSLHCDAQLLFSALRAITRRAVTDCRAGGEVSVSLHHRSDEIVIVVADDSAEVLTAAARATFFELPVTERLTTTVLELALARRIIEQHGGRVAVSPAPKTGNVITLSLTTRPAALPKEHDS